MNRFNPDALSKYLDTHLESECATLVITRLAAFFKIPQSGKIRLSHDRDFHQSSWQKAICDDVSLLLKRPCDNVSAIGIPSPYATRSDLPLYSFSHDLMETRWAEIRAHLVDKHSGQLFRTVGENLTDRLRAILPFSIRGCVCDTIVFWIACELIGEPMRQEADALERLVSLASDGIIPLGFDPQSRDILLIAIAEEEP